jgi:hypothetical protein
MARNDSADVGGSADTSSSETEFDRDALAGKLEDQMAAFNDEDVSYHNDTEVLADDESEEIVADDDSDEENDSQDTQEDEESKESDEVEDDDQSDDEEIEEEAADESDAKSGKTPTLPEAYRRSLAAYGWSDEEIEDSLDNDSAGFIKLATTIHSKRNAEVAQWAELGRKGREQLEAGDPNATVPEQLKPVDLSRIKEKYGDDDLFEEIVGPLNSTIAALNAVLPQVQQGMQAIQQTHTDAAASQVHRFFDAEKLEPYRKFYGGEEQDRTPEQMDHRRDVLEQAVLIMEGAKSLNQEMSLEKALMSAHDTAASDFREQAVRKSIKRVVKKRNRGISQRPSKRGNAGSNSSKPTTEGQRISRVQAGMNKAFGN